MRRILVCVGIFTLVAFQACGDSPQTPTAQRTPSSAGALNSGTPTTPPAASARHITFNGAPLAPADFKRFEALEAQGNVRVPDGDYWYDNANGLWGRWGESSAGFIQAGLNLGGPMPANCSNGNTGVFLDGRELAAVDLSDLQRVVTLPPGRYWMDAQGNMGAEGQAASVNLVQLARQAAATQSNQGTASTGSGTSGQPWVMSTTGPSGNSSVVGDGQGFISVNMPDGSSFTVDH